MKKNRPNQNQNPIKIEIPIMAIFTFTPSILLMPIYFGVTATPNDAYRYAKGEGIMHPMGYEMKLQEPLDFYSVTDHGFFMGMMNAWADTSTDISQKDFAKPFHDLNKIENIDT